MQGSGGFSGVLDSNICSDSFTDRYSGLKVTSVVAANWMQRIRWILFPLQEESPLSLPPGSVFASTQSMESPRLPPRQQTPLRHAAAGTSQQKSLAALKNESSSSVRLSDTIWRSFVTVTPNFEIFLSFLNESISGDGPGDGYKPRTSVVTSIME